MEHHIRTVTCGELTVADVGRTVTLNGWIHRNRDHGGVHFLDLRDRYGIIQSVVDEDAPQELHHIASSLKMEYCISISGIVRARPDGMLNSEMATGSVEVAVHSLTVLNTCPTLPFMIDSGEEVNDTLRLKYRYLYLRTERMRKSMELRHHSICSVRNYLTENSFWEIETPTLIKSTPEGARDYLVPSRVNPGNFYALPQSPQLYKQILMAGGCDRYYQVARCYRDEDARGDRQPEFTQIDLEMSFVSRDNVLAMVEGLVARVFKDVLDVDIPTPFLRLKWREAMDRYGTDKPDLRFGMEFQDFSSFVPGSEFAVFQSVLDAGGVVRSMVVKGAAADYSRKKIGELEAVAKKRGAKGLAWMKVTNDGLDGGVAKFYLNQAGAICQQLGAESGDLILLMGAEWKIAVESLGAVRVQLGKDENLTHSNDFRFCWIVDFPLFEQNADTGAWEPAHHMFSMPQERFLTSMEQNPGAVIGDLYDLVLNGNELGSGSVRIHDPAIQSRVFDIVGFPKEKAEERFGFLLEALRYGAPPHAGLAIGLDRMVMIMAQEETLREVIAFPKNTQGVSPMDGSPAVVDAEQLAELRLNIIEDES